MKHGFLAAFGALAAAIAIYAIVSAAQATHSVNIGEPIRHDDFLFTVERIASQTSGDRTRYHVSILVQNQAVRVGYRWHDAIAYIDDASGVHYRPSTNDEFVLAPGESRITNVAFDLPRTIGRPSLRFWDGIFMGDALNGAAYAKARVGLR